MKIKSLQNSVKFWAVKQEEYRAKYGASPNKAECKHIRALKQRFKKAKADVEYWQAERAGMARVTP
jgi:hypothetical protein